MAENKTKATRASVSKFLAAIDNPQIRADCKVLLKMLAAASNAKPFMLGSDIVGFGHYRYRYHSGREGDSCIISFSPRKDRSTLYAAEWSPVLLKKLGKYSKGKYCLHLRRLADVDLDVLNLLVQEAVAVSRVIAANQTAPVARK